MAGTLPTRQEIIEAIKRVADELGRPPSRAEFKARARLSEYKVLTHFPSWRDAVSATGLAPHTTNIKLEDEKLLQDWAVVVRKRRQIPTLDQYRREGHYNPKTFQKHFQAWAVIPDRFREYARGKSEWLDVVALLPVDEGAAARGNSSAGSPAIRSDLASDSDAGRRHSKLDGRQTYGDPTDFRGLRHEPVNEQGVVFLFGMVARELGYMVEAVQSGFPDCEAKRQVGAGKWQRVRIEFEFESRTFRDHGHPADGCDVVVCWRHNWPDCPASLEVVELSTIIKRLAKSAD